MTMILRNFLPALVILFSCSVRAQDIVPDSNEVFVLERLFKSVPDNLRHLRSFDNCGVVWRLHTGFWLPKPTYNINATVPIVFEAAYKWHFVEMGLRRSYGGAPMSREFGGPIAFSPNTYAGGYPQFSAFQALQFTTTLHGRIFGVPVFIKGGLGKWQIGERPIKQYGRDGKKPSIGVFPKQFGKLSTLEASIQYRSFWAGLGWNGYVRHLAGQRDPNIGSFTSMIVGVQFATGKGDALKNQLQKKRKNNYQKYHFDIGSTVVFSPIRGGAAHAPFIGIGYQLFPKFGLALHAPFGWYDQGHNRVPYSALGGDRVRRYYDLSTLDQQNMVQVIGEFALKDAHSAMQPLLIMEVDNLWVKQIGVDFSDLVFVQAHQALGLAAGMGFNIKYFQTRLVYHQVFSDFPSFFEWKMGIRLSR